MSDDNEIAIVVTGKDLSAPALSTARQRVRDLKTSVIRDLDEVNAKKLRIDADILAAREKIDDLKRQADGATGDRKARFDAEIAAAEAKIKVLQHQSKELADKTIRLRAEVDVDESHARQALGRIVGVAKQVNVGGTIGAGIKVALAGAAAAGAVAVSGAIIAGAATGVAGAAALLQKDNPQLKAAGKGLATTIVDGLREASSGLVSPLTGAVDILRRQFLSDLPLISRAFDAVGDSIEPLAQGLGGLVHNALPGFVSMLRSAEPVIDVLAQELPEVGDALGRTFQTIGATAPYAANALNGLLDLVEGALDLFRSLVVGSTWVSEALHGNFLSMDELREIFRGAPTDFGEASTSLWGLADAGDAATKSMQDMATAMLTMRGDWRATFEAVDQATEALKKNGRTLDISTEKGRENEAALDNVAQSYIKAAQSAKAAGKSQEEQNAITEVGIDRLTNLYIATGKSRTEAAKAARELLGLGRVIGQMPKNVRISVAMPRAAAVLGELGGIQSRIGWINGHPATIRVRTDSANVREDRYASQAHGGIVGGAASGGPRGTLTMVAEQGAELARLGGGQMALLPPGSQVYSNPDTERMLSAGGSGGTQQLEVAWVGGNAGDELLTWLMKNIRIRPAFRADLKAALT